MRRAGARAERDADFIAFVLAAGPQLRRTGYLMCRDWHLAEDLVQTTFVKVYASWGRLRRADNLAAYSRRVLMNLLFDHHRRRSGNEVSLPAVPDRPDRCGDRDGDLHVALLHALATLSVRDQAVVVLRHWEDHSVSTVAEILGLSQSAVKMADARALTRLRVLLGDGFVTM